MTLAQITERVKALTPKQVDRECAEGPMGWRVVDYHNSENHTFHKVYKTPEGVYPPYRSINHWHPSTDRNQSRMVTDKVKPLLGHEGSQFRADWFNITHLDECRAALIAWYWSKENEKT